MLKKPWFWAVVAAIVVIGGISLATANPSLAQTAINRDANTFDNEKMIWGGGPKETSSYTGKIVPVIIDQMAKVRLAGYQWGGPSDGTAMNAMRVTLNPTHVALGQGDILESLNGTPIPGLDGVNYNFTTLKSDIGDECLYLVTKSPHYQTFGHVLENAWDISIATGSELSGSYGTLHILMDIYPDLQDVMVDHVGGAGDIVQSVVDDTNPFGFFVMRADPKNSVFKTINDNNLTLVPVVDFDLEDIYTFKEVKVENAAWGGLAGKAKYLTTACTPIQVITGNPEVADGRSKRRLEATIERMQGVSDAALKEEVVSQFMSWSDYIESVRAIGADKAQELMQAARDAAGEAARQLN